MALGHADSTPTPSPAREGSQGMGITTASFSLVVAFLLCVLAPTTLHAHLVINELMQSNIDCVMDDLNDFPDSWVELYNGGEASEQLNRYALGLTADAADAWPLPTTTVAHGGHTLVYCDKVGMGRHAPFRLESGKGCELFLFLDGSVVDHIGPLPKQPAPNIGYGRSSDGSTDMGYMVSATPGQANSGGAVGDDRLLGSPVFSEAGRVLTGPATITVALSIPEGAPEGTEIRYTADGKEPTSVSAPYRAPISLTSSRVIRARLFCPGWLSPPSATESYIFLERDMTLPVVSIATDNRYLNDRTLGIFANNTKNSRKDWRRPANVEFFMNGPDEPSSINQLCETRVAGGASRGAQIKSMVIYAHKRFGQKRLSYEFFPDQRPGQTDFKSLMLRNAGNDFDYLYMRDAVVQRTMASHTDLDWQAWQPAIVFINGKHHGMLNIRERANEDNVYSNHGQIENIDLIENWSDLKEGTWDAYNDFKAFYKQKGHTHDEYEQWMDCTEFLNIMAMNIFFNNFDFPGNNIIMWRNRDADDPNGGRWRWVAKDCDYTMGLYQQGDASYNTLEWLYTPGYDPLANWANSSSATLLFRNMMEDDDIKRTFTSRMAIYMGDFLNLQAMTPLWDEMYQKISYEYPFHRQKINPWWPTYSTELANARNWLGQRTAQMYSQLASFYQLGTPVTMYIGRAEGDDGDDDDVEIYFNGIRLSKGTFDGKFFTGSAIELKGVAGADNELKGWRVQQYGSSTVTTEVEGDVLTMNMPQCSQLAITPLLGATSGIAAATQRSWSWHRDGRQLHVCDVQPGTHVALYDMRGIMLQQLTAQDDGQLTLTLKPRQHYLLRVGGKSILI